MAKQKVLIATPYFHPVVGGLENYAYALSKGLASTGMGVVVISGDPSVKKVTVEKHDGLKIYRLPIWITISNTPVNPLWYFMIKRIIKAEKPDIINAHAPVPYMADITSLAAGKTPFVLTYHAASLFKQSSLLIRLITVSYLPLGRLTFTRAKSVFAVSDYVKSCLPRSIQLKTFVMPNATYPSDLKVTSNKRGLVFVGSLDKSHAWKGLSLILDSLGLIKSQTGSTPHLTVVGDGDARASYEDQVASLKLSEDVTFTGVLVGIARDKQIAKAQALITYPTSANDAFPTVFLEAWSLGVPVISARIGAIETVVEDGLSGMLATPNDPGSLATTITKSFVNPDYLKIMGRYGKSQVLDTFNWPTQVKRAARLLEQLA